MPTKFFMQFRFQIVDNGPCSLELSLFTMAMCAVELTAEALN